MRMNIGSMVNILRVYKDDSYKDNYIGFINDARNSYVDMLNNSKTLLDVILYNIRINSKFTVSSKLILEDIANLLLNGKECDFSKYLLLEPTGVANSVLKVDMPDDYKNYTNAKFEFDYLINKIGLDGVMKMIEVLIAVKS